MHFPNAPLLPAALGWCCGAPGALPAAVPDGLSTGTARAGPSRQWGIPAPKSPLQLHHSCHGAAQRHGADGAQRIRPYFLIGTPRGTEAAEASRCSPLRARVAPALLIPHSPISPGPEEVIHLHEAFAKLPLWQPPAAPFPSHPRLCAHSPRPRTAPHRTAPPRTAPPRHAASPVPPPRPGARLRHRQRRRPRGPRAAPSLHRAQPHAGTRSRSPSAALTSVPGGQREGERSGRWR